MVMGGKDEDSDELEYIDTEPMDEDKSELDSPIPIKASKTVSGLITILNLNWLCIIEEDKDKLVCRAGTDEGRNTWDEKKPEE